jgi:hypothetical protein
LNAQKTFLGFGEYQPSKVSIKAEDRFDFKINLMDKQILQKNAHRH